MQLYFQPFFAVLASMMMVCDAGTWLSFNQKTGGIDAETLIPQRPMSSMRVLDDGDLMKLIKVCNDQFRKRVSRRSQGPYFTRQERKDVEMCRSVLELVSR